MPRFSLSANQAETFAVGAPIDHASVGLILGHLPFSFGDGFRSKVHKAGVSDNAMNADSITDIAMVMANCWYKRPTMPGINPTGTNTAASISAIATTGAEMSFIAM